jgi:hypothetical protein
VVLISKLKFYFVLALFATWGFVLLKISLNMSGWWPMTLGTLLVATGVFLNTLVKCFNGGDMPAAVRRRARDTPGYTPITHATRLAFLADVIKIRHRNGYIFASAGDVAMVLGLIVLGATAFIDLGVKVLR